VKQQFKTQRRLLFMQRTAQLSKCVHTFNVTLFITLCKDDLCYITHMKANIIKSDITLQHFAESQCDVFCFICVIGYFICDSAYTVWSDKVSICFFLVQMLQFSIKFGM